MDGPNDLEGRLEVCLNNVWGTVCESSWYRSDAAVACRQLGLQSTGEEDFTSTIVTIVFIYNFTGVTQRTSFYGSGEGPPLMILYCTGNEKSIFDCRYDKQTSGRCYNRYVPGIKCEGKGIAKVHKVMNWLIYTYNFRVLL